MRWRVQRSAHRARDHNHRAAYRGWFWHRSDHHGDTWGEYHLWDHLGIYGGPIPHAEAYQ